MTTARLPFVLKLPWPLPALLAWASAWSVWSFSSWLWGDPVWAGLLGAATGAAVALFSAGLWRRTIAAAGFPLSAWALGAATAWPAWAWLALLGLVLLAYPLRAWRDAPFFPTPRDAIQGLDQRVPVPHRVLDAGCGLGHGLRALHRLWPQARVEGVEWSPLLAWAARIWCPWATVHRGDLWAMDWSQHDLVYVFQRPESMDRVWAKACAELAPGACLVSLEFAVAGQTPLASLQRPGERPVWIYRPIAANRGSTAPPPGR